MARGRPKKSLQDHIRDGTYRRDRHGPLPGEKATQAVEQGVSSKTADKLPSVPPAANRQCSASESDLRGELEGLIGQTLTPRDSHMLDELCWWWAELRRVQNQLKEIIPGQKGYKDTLSAAGGALDRVIKIAERFGLTPADRAKLGVGNGSGPVVAKVPVRPKTKLDQQGPPKKD